jgi:hypothetical protein
MSKTVQCKRCGDIAVAWVKSKKTGRFYLAQTVQRSGNYTFHTEVLAHRPHKCDPAEIEKFTAQVAGYAKARGVTVAEWWQGK